MAPRARAAGSFFVPPPFRSPGRRLPAYVPFVIVPLMLLASSAIMAMAWLGHLRFRKELSFGGATALAWVTVLPEYALNIAALRLGYRRFTGGQMAAFRLCSGVVSVAIVSRVVLDEPLSLTKLVGFAIMFFAVFLVASVRKPPPREGSR